MQKILDALFTSPAWDFRSVINYKKQITTVIIDVIISQNYGICRYKSVSFLLKMNY